MPALVAPRAPRVAGSIKVGLGQLSASRDPEEAIAALGLGSCIGLTMHDPVSKVGGMAHVMLPDSTTARSLELPGKYADTAVPALVQALEDLGGRASRFVVHMAGGAQMFSGAGGGVLNIGCRNAVAVRAALQAAGLRLRSADTGGSVGRTLELAVGPGVVTVRSVGGAPVRM
jgi:chemotaxis protein CheD